MSLLITINIEMYKGKMNTLITIQNTIKKVELYTNIKWETTNHRKIPRVWLIH